MPIDYERMRKSGPGLKSAIDSRAKETRSTIAVLLRKTSLHSRSSRMGSYRRMAGQLVALATGAR